MDDAAKAPKSHYATEDRIGVLEELLHERYSVRAFLPREVPRETIDQVILAAVRFIRDNDDVPPLRKFRRFAAFVLRHELLNRREHHAAARNVQQLA